MQNQIIRREQLKTGYVVSYLADNGTHNLILHGTIIHVGLGLAARNALWIRALDGYNAGKIDMVFIDHVVGVTGHV